MKEYNICNKISILDLMVHYHDINFSKAKNIIIWGDNGLYHLSVFFIGFKEYRRQNK